METLSLYRIKLKRGYAARTGSRKMFKSVSKENAQLFAMSELRNLARSYAWRDASHRIYAYERVPNVTLSKVRTKADRLAAYKEKLIDRLDAEKRGLERLKDSWKYDRNYYLKTLQSKRKRYLSEVQKMEAIIKRCERVLND